MSGIKDTTGVRKISIANRVIKIAAINKSKDCPKKSGMAIKPSKAIGAPVAIKGFLRPQRVHMRSEYAPTNGSINNAAMLSRVIMKPVKLALMPKPVTPAVVLKSGRPA